MKAIKDNQSHQVNDTCTDCGSFVDIGAVIGEDDTELLLTFGGDDAFEQARALQEKAVARFSEVHYEIAETVDGVVLKLNFDVAAEKMIFQLEQGI